MDIHAVLADPAQLKALTTLEPAEFRRLVKPFDRAFTRRRKMYKTTGKRRRKPASPVRLARPTKVLPTPEHRLLFVLVGLKTDATQQHLALTFAMKQTTVSKWQRFLEPVLDATLAKLGHRPARTLDQLAAALGAGRGEGAGDDERDERDGGGGGGASPSLHMDATARAVPRSADAAAQRHDYCGKARGHVVKNAVICAADQRVVYLGWSWRGARHDKRIADEELPDLTALAHLDAWLTLDSGYLGYEPPGVHLLAARRARRGHPLTDLEKERNRWVASVRIVVEHAIGAVKRLAKATRMRMLSLDRADRIMQVATSLHNYRVACRAQRYGVSYARTQARLQPFPD